MIISRTPFRISFFGGGTDYPVWYRQYGGEVLATAINKFCYLTCRYLPPFFDHKLRVVYSKIENCNNIDEISHPSARESLRYLGINRGVEIHHDGDLPARSGMGSSSAFTVGLLHALYALKGQMPTKKQLAEDSIYIEQEILKETVGSQDQILAAYGGINHITFFQSGEFSVHPVIIPPERIRELNAHLMLFFTGFKRTAANIAESYINNIEDSKRQLRIIRDMVNEGVSIFARGKDLALFGHLLHESWQVKRSLSSIVSNPHIEEMYERARLAGALGGKLTGAGGGGFLLLFVPPQDHASVCDALKGLIHVPFHFDFSGSQVIFFEQEEDYSAQEEIRSKRPIRAFREISTVEK